MVLTALNIIRLIVISYLIPSGILYTWFMAVRTGTYRYVPVLTCTGTYWYVLVHTSTYDFALSCPGVQDSR